MFEYDIRGLRTAARQIGVACAIGGLVPGFFDPNDIQNAAALTAFGIVIIFISICERKQS